jgi:hypothetical protein
MPTGLSFAPWVREQGMNTKTWLNTNTVVLTGSSSAFASEMVMSRTRFSAAWLG